MKKQGVLWFSILLVLLLFLGEAVVQEISVSGDMSAPVTTSFTPPRKEAGPVSPLPPSQDRISEPAAKTDYAYIANQNTLKFHRPTCSYLPQERNRIYFDNRGEALADGYKPCKKCRP